MTRIARAEGMSIYDYVCFLSDKADENLRRSNEGKEDEETIMREHREIAEEFRKVKILIAENKEPIHQAPKPATPVVPTVEAAVEEPEIESKEEEEEEWEEEEFAEEVEDEYASVRHLFSPEEFSIIFDDDDDLSEEDRAKFIYCIRHKNPFIDACLTQYEQHHGIIGIIDPCNEVPKTEVVRDGDIISVRFADDLPADENTTLTEEPEEVEEDASKEVTLDATPESAISTIHEDSSPITNGDVAHHPEPVIELSLDNARDELSIESIESVDEELSEEIQTKTDSLSTDETATVDRHREGNQVSLDSYMPIIQDSQTQSNTSVDFVFSQEAFQHNPDPLMANEEPSDEAWNPINFLFGIIGFIKNGAKMLASKIDRRRTKGALALPFDSYD